MSKMSLFLQTGADALGNHFAVTMPEVDEFGGLRDIITYRIQTVNIPARSITTYSVTKGGKKATRPSGVSDQENATDITFIGDKLWKCYNAFSDWIEAVQNNETMEIGEDCNENGESNYRHDVVIQAINNLTENFEPTNEWKLIGAFPTNLSDVTFDEESGEPLVFTVHLEYLDTHYPEDNK